MKTTLSSSNSILIVDDNTENLKVLSKILKPQGYEIRIAMDGNQAIEVARSVQPDLILLDIKMPGMTGYEVCDILKKNNKTEEIPILFISALSETLNKVKAFKAGGVDYITKPFHADEVLARVNTHLTIAHLQKELRIANEGLEKRVNERTYELKKKNEEYLCLNEEFKERNEELQASDEELRQTNEELLNAKDLLEKSESRLIEAQKIAKIGHYEVDVNTGNWESSKEVYTIFGIKDNYKRDSESWMHIIHPDFRELVKKYFSDIVQKQDQKFRIEYKIINQKTNDEKWVHANGNFKLYDNNKPATIFGTIQDITKSKQAENLKEAQLRLIDYAQSHSVIRHMQKILDEAELLTGSKIGFIHFVEDDQETLTLQAWSTNTLEKMCNAEGEGSHYPISEAGVWVECVQKGKPIIHNDYASLKHKKGLPEGHAPIIRELVVPVYRKKKIVAILGVGNKTSDYNKQDVKIIQQLANMAWETVVKKQTEETLQKSELELSTIYENAPLIMLLVDEERRIVKMNAQALSMSHKHKGEALGLRGGEALCCLHALDDIRGCGFGPACETCGIRNTTLETIKTEKSFHRVESSFIYNSPNGPVEMFILVSTSPIILSGEKRVLVCLEDITERKNAELDLRENEEKFKDFANSVSDIYFAMDENLKYIFWNAACEKQLGLKSEDVLGKSYFDFNFNKGHEWIAEKYLKIIKTGQSESFETSFNVGGNIIYYVTNAYPTKSGIVVYLQDITQSKIAEQALMESKEKFSNIAENIPGLVFQFNIRKDGSQYFSYISPGSIEFIGIPNDLSNPDWMEFKHIHPDDKSAYLKSIEIAIKNQTRWDFEGRIVTAKKDVKWFKGVSTPMLKEDETSFIGLLLDITEQRQVQQKVLNAVIQTEEAERRRIAQELHDGIGPILSTVKLFTQTFFTSNDEKFKDKIGPQIVSGINDALGQVSTISQNLSPHILSDFGLEAAIKTFITQHKEVSEFDIKFTYQLKERVNKELELTLYRISIELLNNTVKHAKASKINLAIRQDKDNVYVDFYDNGKGFDFNKIKKGKKGMGLFNIYNRINSLNGKLGFVKKEGVGIFYNISIPFLQKEDII